MTSTSEVPAPQVGREPLCWLGERLKALDRRVPEVLVGRQRFATETCSIPLDERYRLAEMCEVGRVVVVGHKATASASTFLRTTG